MGPGQSDGRLGPLSNDGRLAPDLVDGGGEEEGKGLAEGMGQSLGPSDRLSAHRDGAVRLPEQAQGPGAEVEGAGTGIVVPVDRSEGVVRPGLVLRHPLGRMVERFADLSQREQRRPERVMRLQQ